MTWILEDLYVMEQEFREFGHEWGEESYSVYKEQVKQLENDLAEFRESRRILPRHRIISGD